jgi:L-rhamnose mutarotase
VIRKAFRMSVEPAHAAEYERRHNPVWTELEALLRRHGVQRYSIFLDRHTGDLFGVAEVASEEGWQAIAAADVCRRWWRYMGEIMPTNPDGTPRTRELREVFRLGGSRADRFAEQNIGCKT